MKPSGVSQGAMYLRLEQFSVSEKKTGSLPGTENRINASVASGNFFASVTVLSFDNFNDQRGFLDHGAVKKTDTDAADMVGENGYWGVKETSRRISEFVLNGAGEDIDRLKAGREGMLKGFREAEKAWGGTLPDISYATMEKSLQAIDEKIRDMGGSVLDIST